jgi:hypothetical protein
VLRRRRRFAPVNELPETAGEPGGLYGSVRRAKRRPSPINGRAPGWAGAHESGQSGTSVTAIPISNDAVGAKSFRSSIADMMSTPVLGFCESQMRFLISIRRRPVFLSIRLQNRGSQVRALPLLPRFQKLSRADSQVRRRGVTLGVTAALPSNTHQWPVQERLIARPVRTTLRHESAHDHPHGRAHRLRRPQVRLRVGAHGAPRDEAGSGDRAALVALHGQSTEELGKKLRRRYQRVWPNLAAAALRASSPTSSTGCSRRTEAHSPSQQRSGPSLYGGVCSRRSLDRLI